MFARLLFPLCLVLLSATAVSAQLERTLYNIFEVDSVKNIEVDIFGAYELLDWAGNTILVETTVQISHASPAIMNFLIKEGRYELGLDTISEYDRKLYTRVKDRKRIKTPAGECTEIVQTKIYIPGYLVWTDDKKHIRRKTE